MASDTKITRNHAANFDKALIHLRNVICDVRNKKFLSYKLVFYERIGKIES